MSQKQGSQKAFGAINMEELKVGADVDSDNFLVVRSMLHLLPKGDDSSPDEHAIAKRVVENKLKNGTM